MPEPEPVYGTEAVRAATGATRRQLQWWDERGLVEVPINGAKRLYRFRDALYARLLVVLTAKHLTLRRAAQALSQLTGDNDLMRCVDSDVCVMLIGYATGDVEITSHAWLVFALFESDEPLVAVDLRAESMRLAEALN